MLYQQGVPTQDDYYEHDYHVEYSRHLVHKTRTATVRLDTIHRRFPGRDRFRLLDIGCSVGATLAAGKKRGWEATGADVSQQAVDWCKKCGFDAHFMRDGKLPFEQNTFDIITAWHVIEHVSNVNETLAEWLRVLKPGGILAMETPHAGCLKVRLLGRSYEKFWIPDHLYAFRPKNLRAIVERHGMELIPVPIFGRSTGSPLSLLYSWGYQGFKEPLRRMGIAKAFQIMARKPQLACH
jgi:2-polyprenyl-3-methyl-5-hydroxy-6-metoxy-1,4-benzoquinol methylase